MQYLHNYKNNNFRTLPCLLYYNSIPIQYTQQKQTLRGEHYTGIFRFTNYTYCIVKKYSIHFFKEITAYVTRLLDDEQQV